MKELKKINSKIDYTNKITDISTNKVIIIGDSRMELINNYKNDYIVPTNFSFIAKGGTKLEWFEEEALPLLYKKLDNKNSKYKYHVVINMGINDIDMVSDYEKNAYKYFEDYKDLFIKYPNIKFYILSVNPIEKNLLQKYWSQYTTQNYDIEKFNSIIIFNINKNKKNEYILL